MARRTRRQAMEELRKCREEREFLMERWKDRLGKSGEDFGTVLFLNGDGPGAEAALLAELSEVEGLFGSREGGLEAVAFLVEWRQAVLRLIRKYNRCRNLYGQYGKNYALRLDLEEFCLMRRILDGAGIAHWEH